MDAKDILAMLDLDGADKPRRSRPGRDALDAVPSGVKTASNVNAFAVDEWGRRRGADLHSGNPGSGLDAVDWADVHHALFDPKPTLLEGCADPAKRQYLADLMETSDFADVRRVTRLDVGATEAAATAVAKGLAAFRTARRKDPKASPFGPIGSALAAAVATADEYRESARGLFPGTGPGSDDGKTDPAAALAAYQRVRHSARLRAIIDLAGRFRRVAQSKQRHRVDHGDDEVTGVTIGGEISRLLPVELARLMLPATALDTLRRVAEHEALCREHQGVEPVARGPLVVLVDESSSMEEARKIETAKGLALALAYVARKQRRWVCLVSFSSGNRHKAVVLAPGRWDETALLGWLEHFYRGGTSAHVLMEVLPQTLWGQLMAAGAARGKTDVMVLTDGQIGATQDQIDGFVAWKAAERVKLHTVMVHDRGGILPALSDHLYEVGALTPEGEAAAELLAV